MSVSFEKKGVSNDPTALAAFNRVLRKYEPLPWDEQVKLAVMAKNGDMEAQDKLVKSNQRFIMKVTQEYQNSTMSVLDLVNEELENYKRKNPFNVNNCLIKLENKGLLDKFC